jgi:hypothetical protein
MAKQANTEELRVRVVMESLGKRSKMPSIISTRHLGINYFWESGSMTRALVGKQNAEDTMYSSQDHGMNSEIRAPLEQHAIATVPVLVRSRVRK